MVVCVCVSRESDKVVMGLEGENWFAFELPATLAPPPSCGRRGWKLHIGCWADWEAVQTLFWSQTVPQWSQHIPSQQHYVLLTTEL